MTGIAVLDLETTGTYFGTDRIVEIGVIHLDHELNETMRWTSLVNPQRAVTAQDIHGISALDTHRAPTLAELAEDVCALLHGRAVVAHNATFDVNHLMLGLARARAELPDHLPAVVDTMRLSARVIGARSLANACDVMSIDRNGAHEALADAEATAELLRRLVEVDEWELPHATTGFAPHPATGFWRTLPISLPALPDPVAAVVDAGSRLTWPGRLDEEPPRDGFTRSHAGMVLREETRYLARLVASLPVVDDDPNSDATPYVALLDEALEDRLVTSTEADALVSAAGVLGLSQTEVMRANASYLTALAAAAWVDGVISTEERADLDAVADVLGLPAAAVDQALDTARQRAERREASATRIDTQPGDKIVFTGTMSRPRAELEARATRAGLVPTTSISRRTSLLVIADPHSQSGKARKARDLGVRLISEPVFDEICTAMR